MSESPFWRCVCGFAWLVYLVFYVALILVPIVAALWFFGNLAGNYVSPMGGRRL